MNAINMEFVRKVAKIQSDRIAVRVRKSINLKVIRQRVNSSADQSQC